MWVFQKSSAFVFRGEGWYFAEKKTFTLPTVLSTSVSRTPLISKSLEKHQSLLVLVLFHQNQSFGMLKNQLVKNQEKKVFTSVDFQLFSTIN